MVKYDVVVLFKNGVEKVFENIVSDEDNAAKIMNKVDANYKLGGIGGLNLGLIVIRVDETVCIELKNLCETDDLDEL